jgi:pimeloyl-ACP methyl ester carboxylesterase
VTQRFLLLPPLALFLAISVLPADGPADNDSDKARPIPPPGITLDGATRQVIAGEVAAFGKEIAELRDASRSNPDVQELLPDVEIFHKAILWALQYNEFHNENEVKKGRLVLLAEGRKRLQELKAGKPTWTTATGLVVRGFRSRIDGSVQPYGLVVPVSYKPGSPALHRLDVWLHGRGEKSSELAFLTERMRSAGPISPANTFVLHPYGRYCNAFKFAGEIDVLEALDHVRRHYPIDENRVAMRGFSMGGAGCWQMAVHHPDRWVAVAPGAGFCETREFLAEFQGEKVDPPAWERSLWGMYDCPNYVVNLFNLPVVAYSGEKDRQKQAADLMEKAMARKGIELVHLIGPDTGHSYHPITKKDLDQRIDRLAALGRERVPLRIHFTTPTLRYPRSFWVSLDGLGEHWKFADVTASFVHDQRALEVETTGVTGLTLSFRPGECPLPFAAGPRVTIDRQEIPVGPVRSDRSWSASFTKKGERWGLADKPAEGLRKRPGLQGPIDDAFLDSFVFVRPTGKPFHEATGQWVQQELAHAITHWRQQFRGDARVVDDTDVSEADLANHHLVLWGDPTSNKVLGRLLARLPLRWNGREVRLGPETFAANSHVPLMIYPNPLSPKRYIVLNSSFTYREYDYLNNARQVPKLPDWAILDIRTPPNPRRPGRIASAGFFDEGWQVAGKPAR